MPRVHPLYRSLREYLKTAGLASANVGLVYDRYADIWSGPPDWKPEKPERGKAERQRFLDDIAGLSRDVALYVEPYLRAQHERREALWRQRGARIIELQLVAPLASGLGMTHSLEVGFVWDRNLGVPYLPGTSVKGATRAYARYWATMDNVTELRIFGDLADSGAGSVVFHALYPLRPPALRVDVLNPHFPDYYRTGQVPGDWQEPNPVFFLTVPVGEVFRTALHLRDKKHPQDLNQAEVCLRDALATLGIGAKTAVGYGIFAPSSNSSGTAPATTPSES